MSNQILLTIHSSIRTFRNDLSRTLPSDSKQFLLIKISTRPFLFMPNEYIYKCKLIIKEDALLLSVFTNKLKLKCSQSRPEKNPREKAAPLPFSLIA